MKRTFLAALVATIVTSSSGCCLMDRIFHCGGCCGPAAAYGGCDSCGGGYGGCDSCGGGYGGGCDGCDGGYGGPEVIDSGPQVGASAYPYYTTRGPRDYLTRNPRSIGP